MGSLNVNRSVSDAFYRYKMPRICAKVEGKGNGIKTVIVNMTEVAKAIGRPATYPTKYFGCELGAQTQFDFKNERFIVNGSHDAAKLQDLLDGFIRKFVLCPECDNPETELLVSTKKGTISQGCKACGYHGLLEFNHKLNTYILKNPPNINPANQGSSLTEGNRGKRSKKAANGDDSVNENNDSHISCDGESINDVSLTPTTPAPQTPATPSSGGGEMPSLSRQTSRRSKHHSDEDDDVNWTVDVSEEAVRARLQDLTDGAKNMTLTDDLEKTEKQRMDLFHAYLQHRNLTGEVDTQKAHLEILHEAERLDVKSKGVLVVCEVLVRPSALAADLRRRRALLLRFSHGDLRAQKALLGAVEIMVAENRHDLMAKVPAILKLLYDGDMVEEAAVLEWAGRVSRKYVSREIATELRKRAAPFVRWLQEAEEEEDSSDNEADGQEDVEIEYDDRAKTTSMKEQAAASRPATNVTTKKNPAPDEEENDVDIDAI